MALLLQFTGIFNGIAPPPHSHKQPEISWRLDRNSKTKKLLPAGRDEEAISYNLIPIFLMADIKKKRSVFPKTLRLVAAWLLAVSPLQLR